MKDRFEDELRQALERREPPPGFTDRVMARIVVEPRRSWLQRLFSARQPARTWVPAVAACVVMVIAAGTWEYKESERRRQAEQVKQELVFALEITSAKLERTRTKLLENVGGML